MSLVLLVCRFLALVCLLREEVFDRQGLIEYNFHCFREAIQEVYTTDVLVYLELVSILINTCSGYRCLTLDEKLS